MPDLQTKKYVAIVGTGVDGQQTLTREAQDAVEQAQMLLGAQRMLEPYGESEKQTVVSGEQIFVSGKQIFVSFDSEALAQQIESSDLERFAVLMSGDCGFYSGAQKLAKLLENHGDIEVRLISGISSAVYFCNLLGVPWSDVRFVSLHGQSANVVREVAAHERTLFLLGGSGDAGEVCRKLCEYGLKQVRIAVGERLGYSEEHCTRGTAQELTEIQTDRLAVLLAENPAWERSVPMGIPEADFVRGQVPITKPEVRLAAIARLKIERNSVCWDIGCGTGSVSVEMALHCPEGSVYAVDHHAEAIGLTSENAHRFACDNIHILQGEASRLVPELPAPDCVFIGGGSGELEAVLCATLEKNAAARIALTAVTLETLHEGVILLERFGRVSEVTQLAVTRTRKVGAHTMLQAENPVYLIASANK